MWTWKNANYMGKNWRNYENKLQVYKWQQSNRPGSVAQLDARSTGDQEGVSSRLRSGNILSLRLIMKSFLRSFSPFRWFKKGSCQLLAKECALSTGQLLNSFKSAQEKCG